MASIVCMGLRTLFPDTLPRRRHRLRAGGGHVLQVDEFGAAGGTPALVLHGGPGSGCGPLLRRVFDPTRWRVVCVDQRGAGGSTPRGETRHNTTAHLLADLQRLRAALGVGRWFVVGGSWGATLAVLHAADQPAAVSGLLLRNSFLARPTDIEAFFEGAPVALREGWRRFAEHHPAGQRALAVAWWHWERARGGLAPAELPDVAAALDRFRVQAHYLRQAAFLAEPLLATAARVRLQPPRPVLLLHGAEDRVCPLEGARALAAVLPGARLQVLPGVGHDAAHPVMVDAMMRALEAVASHGRLDTETSAA